ncbi:MAG: hypothetical protein ICV69_09710 [Thermoleophilaceae bacterium]|nr:hypothetical protein [Thermoleophilaceae bacterium]
MRGTRTSRPGEWPPHASTWRSSSRVMLPRHPALPWTEKKFFSDMEICAIAEAHPVPASRGSVDDAEQRTDRKLDSQLEPRAKLLPGPFVHADLAASSALAVADEQRAAAVIEIGFGETEGFMDA